jgi:hypothetical protein
MQNRAFPRSRDLAMMLIAICLDKHWIVEAVANDLKPLFAAKSKQRLMAR